MQRALGVGMSYEQAIGFSAQGISVCGGIAVNF